MGLSMEMKQAMDKWLETAKSELNSKLEKMCNGLEEKLLQTMGKLETRIQQLEGENGVLKH